MHPILVALFVIWILGTIPAAYWIFEVAEDDGSAIEEVTFYWKAGRPVAAMLLTMIFIAISLVWPAFVLGHLYDRITLWRDRRQSDQKDQKPGS